MYCLICGIKNEFKSNDFQWCIFSTDKVYSVRLRV